MTSIDDMNAIDQWHAKRRIGVISARKLKREEKKKAKQAKKDYRKRLDKADWDAKLARDAAYKKSCSLQFDREEGVDVGMRCFYKDMDVTGAALTARYNELNRTSRHMVNSWSEDRVGRDMFMVKQVQSLWDACVSLYRRVAWMKRMAIERGAARYNPSTGDFEWMPVPEKIEEVEKVVDKI